MKRILFVLPLLVALMLHAEEAGVHRFANYNIRYVNASNGDTGEKLWANRREYVVRNITGYDFDIVGMEEVTGNNKDATTGKSQLQDLRDMLTGYADYSVEREGKSYSYNSIFYKTANVNVTVVKNDAEYIQKAISLLCEKVLENTEFTNDFSFTLDATTVSNKNKRKCC